MPILRLPLTFSALMLLGALLGGCSTNPVSKQQDFVTMSESSEVRLGKQVRSQVLAEDGVVAMPGLQRKIAAIGKEMADKSHRPELNYEFYLLDSSDVNAFAAPGGFIFITRGLLAYLNSEAELAAVLGHEIGHVTARHSVRNQAQSQLTGLLATVVGVSTGSNAIFDLANLAGTALVRGYGREHELEADRLGAEYLARVGYDPDAMIGVLRVLKNQNVYEKAQAKAQGREPRTGYSGLFATHPDNDTRLREVVSAAKPQLQGAPRKPSPDAFLKQLEGLAVGDSEDQGVIRGQRFYHASLDFTIQAPSGWRFDNQADRLILLAPRDAAFVQLTLADPKSGQSPRSLLKSLGVSRIRSDENVRHNGEPGITGLTTVETPWGNRDGRVAVLYKDGQAFVFVAAAKSTRDPYRFDHEALQIAKSLRSLNPAEAGLARPKSIRLYRVKSGDNYTNLAARFSNANADELRLLNGDYPNGSLQAGRLIKIVN